MKIPFYTLLYDIVIAVAAIATIFAFFATAYQIRNSNKIQQINTLRDLVTQFDTDPLYGEIRKSIDRCERLYKDDLGLKFPKSSKGKYDFDQISRYLNFFDNLAFYESQKALTPIMVNHSFGAWIIEAYEYNELRAYIDKSQRDGGEPRAFKDFQRVASELEEDEFNNQETIKMAQKCNQYIQQHAMP